MLDGSRRILARSTMKDTFLA